MLRRGNRLVTLCNSHDPMQVTKDKHTEALRNVAWHAAAGQVKKYDSTAAHPGCQEVDTFYLSIYLYQN